MLKSACSRLPLLLALSAVGLAACDDAPPTPSEVRARITSDLGNVLRETNAAIEGGTADMPGEATLELLERVLDTDGGSLAPSVLGRLVRPEEPGGSDAIDVDEAIAQLNDKLFSDDNHLGDGIYAIPAELVCTEQTFDQDGNSIETIDPECAARLAEAELRIRVASRGDRLTFAIQVGADHDEPLVLTLTRSSLAITIDLDDAGRALTALAPIVGERAPNVSLAGQVTGSLAITGPARIELAVTIDRALAIAIADDGVDLDGPDAVRVSSAKADVAKLTLDGAARTGSLVIGLGATALHLPDDGRAIELDLPAATAVAMFGAGQPLQLTHLGLGNRSTTLTIDGKRAITLDVNRDDGRAFGATVTRDPASGFDTLTVAPKLDLRLATDHVVLDDTRPVYDVTQLLIDGSLRGSGDRIAVVSGTLRIATDPAGFGIEATAGQCATAIDAEDVPSGQTYTQWSVGACP